MNFLVMFQSTTNIKCLKNFRFGELQVTLKFEFFEKLMYIVLF